MLLKWIKQTWGLNENEPKETELVKPEIRNRYNDVVRTANKSAKMVCSDCAVELNGSWPLIHYANLRMGMCDVCKKAKPTTSIYDWTWEKKSRMHQIVALALPINFKEETLETLKKQPTETNEQH